jgi:hypothetical protein
MKAGSVFVLAESPLRPVPFTVKATAVAVFVGFAIRAAAAKPSIIKACGRHSLNKNANGSHVVPV